jgi:hypothetical protein
MNATIRIRMLKTVVPDFPFYLTGVKDGTHLLRDGIYSATSNSLGAVSGLCHNGQQLGVKPGEFEFVEAPEWLLSIHRKCEPQDGFFG